MKQEQLVNLPIDWKRGSGLRKSDLDKDGKNKCILYGELYTKHKNVLIESCNISRTNKIGVVYSNKGDVLVPGTSTASKEDMLLAREIDEDGVFLGGDINIIRPKQGIFAKKYLPYFFETFTAYDQLDRYITGATGIIHLSNTGLKNLKVPLPTFQEQQRIVSILDETFAAIAKAKANAEQNLINAKELFENYLQGVFENSGKDWRDKSLGEVCEYDKTPNKKSLPYVGLEHIESNSGKFIGELKQFKVKSSTFYFNQEHVLYGRLRPYLNKVLLPTFEGHCSTEIFPIKCKNGLDRGFLFHWLIAKETMTKINATWTGARMPRANMNVVLEFKIPVPPLKEQQIIVQKLDALKIETKKLENIYQQKINDLEELKKSILQKAFSGELTATMPKSYVIDEPFLPVAAEPVVTYKRASGLNDDEWLQLYLPAR